MMRGGMFVPTPRISARCPCGSDGTLLQLAAALSTSRDIYIESYLYRLAISP